MRRWFRFLTVIGLLSLPVSSRAQPPSTSWPSPSSWMMTQKAKCGEVRGRIVRWPSGLPSDSVSRPMEGAFVRTGMGTPPIDQASQGAVVGPDGGFIATLDTARITLLFTRMVGFVPVKIALDNEIAKAYVVEVMMRPAALPDPEKGLAVYSVRAIAPCTP